MFIFLLYLQADGSSPTTTGLVDSTTETKTTFNGNSFLSGNKSGANLHKTQTAKYSVNYPISQKKFPIPRKGAANSGKAALRKGRKPRDYYNRGRCILATVGNKADKSLVALGNKTPDDKCKRRPSYSGGRYVGRKYQSKGMCFSPLGEPCTVEDIIDYDVGAGKAMRQKTNVNNTLSMPSIPNNGINSSQLEDSCRADVCVKNSDVTSCNLNGEETSHVINTSDIADSQLVENTICESPTLPSENDNNVSSVENNINATLCEVKQEITEKSSVCIDTSQFDRNQDNKSSLEVNKMTENDLKSVYQNTGESNGADFGALNDNAISLMGIKKVQPSVIDEQDSVERVVSDAGYDIEKIDDVTVNSLDINSSKAIISAYNIAEILTVNSSDAGVNTSSFQTIKGDNNSLSTHVSVSNTNISSINTTSDTITHNSNTSTPSNLATIICQSTNSSTVVTNTNLNTGTSHSNLTSGTSFHLPSSISSLLSSTSGTSSLLPCTSGTTSLLTGTSGPSSLLPCTSGTTSLLTGTSGLSSLLPCSSGPSSLLP